MLNELLANYKSKYTRRRWNNVDKNRYSWIVFEGTGIMLYNNGMCVTGGTEYSFDYKDIVADDWQKLDEKDLQTIIKTTALLSARNRKKE